MSRVNQDVNQQSNPHGWREPVAWTAIAVAGGYLLDGVLQVARIASRPHLGVANGALAVGGQSLPAWVLLAMAAAALACALGRPATPSAGRILRAAGLVAGLGAVLELVLLVVGLFSHGLDGFGVLLDLLGGVLSITLKAVVAWVLLRVAHDRTAGSVGAGEVQRGDAASPEPAIASDHGARATGQPAGVAPAWSPDQAIGTVWTRAGDAATGAAGHQEATSVGWQVKRPIGADRIGTEGVPTTVTPPADDPRPVGGNDASPRGGWATAGELAAGQQPGVPAPDADESGRRSAPVWRAAGDEEAGYF